MDNKTIYQLQVMAKALKDLSESLSELNDTLDSICNLLSNMDDSLDSIEERMIVCQNN